MKGHFTKAGVAAKKYVKEFNWKMQQTMRLAQKSKLMCSQQATKVDASGVSKGKGFQSTIKRYNASRGPMGHGSKSHRVVGSMGSSAYPQPC